MTEPEIIILEEYQEKLSPLLKKNGIILIKQINIITAL